MELDIDLGIAGDPHGPVKEAFARRGVPLSDDLVTRLRSGATTSTRTAYRLGCADRLQANDAALKTDYCLRVIAAGLEHRQPSHEPPRVYACFGLTRAMEAALGCTHLELSYVLRVMRADLAFWSTHPWADDLVLEFREAASLFLRVHSHRNWRVLRHTNDYVSAAWDQRTIHGFYFALYHTAGSLTRASWLPYELDLLQGFYARQRELGNPLTPLDRRVLAAAVSLSPTTSMLSRMVRAHVGVDYDHRGVTIHRHQLVAGTPEPIQATRRKRIVRPSPAVRERSYGQETRGQADPTGERPSRPRRHRGPARSALSYFREAHQRP
jgi:hypothetical protein